jgi:BirA family biotin operon repressor/biotin-[acetyl-CoA-carboxylase] ligase
MRLASAGAAEGTVVVCREQTAGRGQRDNRWESAPDENLTVSLILRPTNLASDELFLLSKIFSLAVVKALNQYNIDAAIKWPNDIYVRNSKIAGILIEHSFFGNDLSFTVIGLGLNINQTVFPPMDIIPVSMATETGKIFEKNEVLSAVLDNVSSLYQSEREYINRGYMEKLYRRQGYFPYKKKDGEMLIAEIVEVADSGKLVLKDENGNISSFLFKEIACIF